MIHSSKIVTAQVTAICFAHQVLGATGFDWPQWRGPERTDISKETGLLQSWPSGGPKRVWLFENAGEGYAGPATFGGKLFTLGTRDESECLLAIDTGSGQGLWVAKFGSVFRERRGNGPRGTPTVDGERVYAMSARGVLVCATASNGKILWQQDMNGLGGQTPHWGYTESVLVDGDQVVCTPGGAKGAMAALEKKTGKLLWQSAEFTAPAHYASVIAVHVNGARQYIQITERQVVGIAASDGKLLWKSAFPGRTAVIPTPIFKDNHVYVTAGYGAGCKLIKIGPRNEASDVYQNTVMKNHHGGVILIGDHLYGHSDGGGWICQNFATGEEVWSERRALGKGAIAYADGRLYCQDEGSGNVVLIEASPNGWKEHGRFKLNPQSTIRTEQGRIWTHPVISNGRLYLRDQNLIFCYDVKAN